MAANIFTFRLSADWLRAYADYLAHLQEEHSGHFYVNIGDELVADGLGFEVMRTTFNIEKEEGVTGKTARFTPATQQAEGLARLFHATYERLAPQHGYTTRTESAVEWEQTPANFQSLMLAVAGEILKRMQPPTKVEALPEQEVPGE